MRTGCYSRDHCNYYFIFSIFSNTSDISLLPVEKNAYPFFDMKRSIALTGAMAATAALGQTLTASMIESMGNNTLFTRWRPQNHFIAPAGWQNDPCGLMYDPTEDLYHAFYQWHPEV